MGAKLQLTVESNFKEAGQEFKRFGSVSEAQKDRIDKSFAKIKGRSKTTLDGLQTQLELTAKSYRNVGDESKALGAQSKLLERKIFALTKAGGDGSEAMGVLQKELADVRATMEQNDRKTRMLTNAKKALKIGAAAVAAAMVAASAAIIKNTFDIATMGDEYAKTARNIGVTAEELQEFEYIAERTGVAPQKMSDSLKKMNENVGKARAGQGELFSMLSKTNPALLDQVINAENSGEAFDLLVGELRDTSDAMDRTALATAFFGRGGRDMGNIAATSAKDIEGMKERVHELGIISNETAAASEAFADAQLDAQKVVQGLRNELGAALIPIVTKVMQVFTNLVKSGGPLRTMFENVVTAVRPALAHIGKAAIFLFKLDMIIRQKILGSLVMLARKMWDIQTAIFQAVIQPVKDMIGLLQKIPFVKEVFDQVGDLAKTAGNKIKEAAGDISQAVDDEFDKTAAGAVVSWFAVQGAELDKQAAIKETTEVLGDETNKRLDIQAAEVDATKQATTDIVAAFVGRLQSEDQLLDEQQIKRVQGVQKHLQDVALMEGEGFEMKMERLAAEKDRLLTLDSLTAEERKAIEDGYNDHVNKLSLERMKQQAKERTDKVNNVAGFLGDSIGLIKAFGKDSAKAQRAAAIAQKGIDIAAATIKGILATQAAFAAAGGYPAGIPASIATGVQAGVNVAAIAATPIPTAETGGRFTVPDDPTTSRADSVGVNVSGGETVEVTPRGEEAGRTVVASIYLDARRLWSTVQDGVDAGRIVITDRNIRTA